VGGGAGACSGHELREVKLKTGTKLLQQTSVPFDGRELV